MVHKTYGYGFLLPVMLASMLAATEPKAFLMAMVIPLSQSTISFLLDTIWGKRKGNRDDMRRRPFQEKYYHEDATDFATGGRGNGYHSSSNYYEGRWKTYQSRVSNNFADAASTGVGANDDTRSSSSGDDRGNKSGGGYGGWDELLDNDTTAAQKAKRRSSFSAGNTDQSMKWQASVTGEEDADYTAASSGRKVEQGVGAPSRRMRMRRRQMPRSMGSVAHVQSGTTPDALVGDSLPVPGIMVQSALNSSVIYIHPWWFICDFRKTNISGQRPVALSKGL